MLPPYKFVKISERKDLGGSLYSSSFKKALFLLFFILSIFSPREEPLSIPVCLSWIFFLFALARNFWGVSNPKEEGRLDIKNDQRIGWSVDGNRSETLNSRRLPMTSSWLFVYGLHEWNSRFRNHDIIFHNELQALLLFYYLLIISSL